MNTQPEVIDTIVERIGSNPHVEKVILFGSRARGDEEERSDIDLAVVGPEITRDDWREMRDYIEETARTLLFIDLLRFETAPSNLKESIIKEGVTLYDRH